MKKNILYIGRFQPFHKGHTDAIHQIFEKYDHQIRKLYIGIGSAEDNFLPKNPLTASERFQIIESALEELKIPAEKWAIVPIRNINLYSLWTQHVQQYLPPIDVVASGSSIVQMLFRQEENVEIFPIEKRTNLCASDIRKKLLKGEHINEYLLSSTQKHLKDFHFYDRMRIISENNS